MNHNPNRTVFFWCAIVATPLAVFASCEGLARLLSPPGDAFLALRGNPLFFERFERGGEPHVRIAHDELYGSGSVELPLAKPPGTLRVFSLGGSASAGWPHPPSQGYPRLLQHALSRALPGRRVEVFDGCSRSSRTWWWSTAATTSSSSLAAICAAPTCPRCCADSRHSAGSAARCCR
jgi:hypothetical protein